MASYNQIVSRNVEKAISDAIERAEESGRKLTRAAIWRSVAQLVGVSPGAVDRQVKRFSGEYRDSKNPACWRIDYLHAIGQVTGVPVERLVALDYSESKIPEADYGKWLARSLGGRVKPRILRRLVNNVASVADWPGMLELTMKVSEALHATADAHEADRRIAEILRRNASVWEATPPLTRASLRSSRQKDRKKS